MASVESFKYVVKGLAVLLFDLTLLIFVYSYCVRECRFVCNQAEFAVLFIPRYIILYIVAYNVIRERLSTKEGKGLGYWLSQYGLRRGLIPSLIIIASSITIASMINLRSGMSLAVYLLRISFLEESIL